MLAFSEFITNHLKGLSAATRTKFVKELAVLENLSTSDEENDKLKAHLVLQKFQQIDAVISELSSL